MPAKPDQSPLQRRRPTLARWAVAIAAGVAIVGCRPNSPPQTEAINPAPAAPTDSAPEPAAQSTEPPTATTAAPATTPTATLPISLIKEWQPLSDVLLAFGPMTLTPDQVQWGSGQTSPYTLVSTEGGYLLELGANPSFYDTQNRYIKLIPKADTNTANSIEVAFYTNSDQLQSDEYVMYGGYFAE
ncbi:MULTISPECIES: hypothetical protein [Cyanophyceae]|uniref:Uncharacterized protein n=1 Tax=Leptolyngbya subtilissima DQ-A4 TaxID=2933933 RepID=A0ABV0K1Z9_9CYAN|nr:hypothetical protein [Nodosilinea sp. FACHB-141]MBD2111564.1 hypothetical protein [Nodosilinea sp. FACHB-141]